MQYTFWKKRWTASQIGFHLEQVREDLIRHFPTLPAGSHVLVPLCGKSRDLLWLAEQGYAVTGVEFVEQAARDFFSENGLKKSRQETSLGSVYRATQWPLEIIVGDFFKFKQTDFDALYDRAAMIALPQDKRGEYVAHCRERLKDDARVVLVTLDYPQEMMVGPPFSVASEEVEELWEGSLEQVESNDIRSEDGKYKDTFFDYFNEVTYRR